MGDSTGVAPVWGRAALPLPNVGLLLEPQQRGIACAWCRTPLTTETAVELGSQRIKILDTYFTAFPRGCRPCTAAHARKAMLAHGVCTERCAGEAGLCPTDMALRRLIREAMTEPWSSLDVAWLRWSGHVIKCRVCLADDSRCERGKRLEGVWRPLFKAAHMKAAN